MNKSDYIVNMSSVDTTAEEFLTAFKALDKEEKTKLLRSLLADEECEDLFDGIVIDSRKDEPSRNFDEFLSEVS